MDILTKLAERHSEWVSMARAIGCGISSDDVVQDMYLRIHKYKSMELTEDGEVNSVYVWYVLNNLFKDGIRKANKLEVVSIGEGFEIEQIEDVEQKEESYTVIIDKIKEEVDSWTWYDRKLFNLYTTSNLSMRGLHEETNISLSSIFNTLKNCKERIKANVGEDYEDYLNKDYDKI
jgi:DNA-directed RNA polymerase specialized sigma24 family protein